MCGYESYPDRLPSLRLPSMAACSSLGEDKFFIRHSYGYMYFVYLEKEQIINLTTLTADRRLAFHGESISWCGNKMFFCLFYRKKHHSVILSWIAETISTTVYEMLYPTDCDSQMIKKLFGELLLLLLLLVFHSIAIVALSKGFYWLFIPWKTEEEYSNYLYI